MIRTLPSLAIIGAAAALSSCAPNPAVENESGVEAITGLDTGRQCFFTRTVSNFSEAPDGPGGSERIFVDTGARAKFVLEAYGACPDVDFATRIGFQADYGPSLCTGDTADLIVPSGTGVDRCPVRVIGRVVEDD